jgi:hypothetical protein
MENLDIRSVIPILKQLGISPDKLGPERLEELMKISEKITGASDLTPEITSKIMDIIGIIPKARVAQKIQTRDKIGRNSQCPCGKYGKKYKKCCWINETKVVSTTE